MDSKIFSNKCTQDQAKMIIPFMGDAMDNLFSELTNYKFCKIQFS